MSKDRSGAVHLAQRGVNKRGEIRNLDLVLLIVQAAKQQHTPLTYWYTWARSKAPKRLQSSKGTSDNYIALRYAIEVAK